MKVLYCSQPNNMAQIMMSIRLGLPHGPGRRPENGLHATGRSTQRWQLPQYRQRRRPPCPPRRRLRATRHGSRTRVRCFEHASTALSTLVSDHVVCHLCRGQGGVPLAALPRLPGHRRLHGQGAAREAGTHYNIKTGTRCHGTALTRQRASTPARRTMAVSQPRLCGLHLLHARRHHLRPPVPIRSAAAATTAGDRRACPSVISTGGRPRVPGLWSYVPERRMINGASPRATRTVYSDEASAVVACMALHQRRTAR